MDFLSSKDKRKLQMIQLFFWSNEGLTRTKLMEELAVSGNTLTNDIYAFNDEMNKYGWFLETNEQNLLVLTFPPHHSLATYEAVLFQNTVLYEIALATLDHRKLTSVHLMEKYNISYSTLYREIKKTDAYLKEKELSIHMKEQIYITGGEATIRKFLYFFFTKVMAAPSFNLQLYYKNDILNFVKMLEKAMKTEIHALAKAQFCLSSEIILRRYLANQRASITPEQYAFHQDIERTFSLEESFKQLPFELPIAEKIHFFAQFLIINCPFSEEIMKKRIDLAKIHSATHYLLAKNIIEQLPDLKDHKLRLYNNILNFLDNYMFVPRLLSNCKHECYPWTKATAKWDNTAVEQMIQEQITQCYVQHPELVYLDLDKEKITLNIMAQIHAAYLSTSYKKPIKVIVMSINGVTVESYFKTRILQHTNQEIIFLDNEDISQADIIISDYPFFGCSKNQKMILWNKEPSERDWENFDLNTRKVFEEQLKTYTLHDYSQSAREANERTADAL